MQWTSLISEFFIKLSSTIVIDMVKICHEYFNFVYQAAFLQKDARHYVYCYELSSIVKLFFFFFVLLLFMINKDFQMFSIE